MRHFGMLFALAVGVVVSLALVVVRIAHTETLAFAFLLWNLFLAWLPLLFAWLADRSRRWPLALSWMALWLLFFPNAPYIVTDFVHLAPRTDAPFWYDLMMLLTLALVGLLLGLSSLRLVHGRVSRQFGGWIGWLVVVASCGLAGLGVVIGRFLRWNSWDALLNPVALAQDVAVRLPDWKLLAMSALLALLLLIGYAVMAGAPLSAETPRRT